MNFGLSKAEEKIYRKLSTPQKVQDFLNTLSIHPDEEDDTCNSPRVVLKQRKSHCMEGALLAASILWYHGHEPLLLDLVAHKTDFDHVVVLFQQQGRWGAISKSNHSVLRWRDPVYLSIRELVMSYFHEYYLPDGTKSLYKFSKPFNLKKFGTKWVTSDETLMTIADRLDESPHVEILSPAMKKNFRKADKVERVAGDLTVWKNGAKPKRIF
jgi:hypothetical protein